MPAANAALVIVALLGLSAVACEQQDAGAQPRSTAMPDKTIEQVLSEHTDRLMSIPGVVGTAQGECAGTPCIKVLVVEQTPAILNEVPSSIDGYTVELLTAGEIKALDPE